MNRVIKIAFVCGIIALLGYLIHRGLTSAFRSAQESPYPDTTQASATEFYTALQNQDHQSCYKLLAPARKGMTIIRKQNRENYFYHFDRIRTYLKERIGDDFTSYMQIANDGTATFDDYIVLTMKFDARRGLDEKIHYAIMEINEFPIDIAPDIGMEKYYRGVDRALQSLDSLTINPDTLDDPAEIVRQRPGESHRQRLERLIQACKLARQLDTRHTLLEWIIKEFGGTKTTQNFLLDLAQDENEVYQLRLLAQNALDM